MAAHSVRLLGAKLWQPDESPHSNGLVAKEQKWLKTKGRNSWGWMSGDKCISTSWHFHHHLIDHLWDIFNAETCVDVCASMCARVFRRKHTWTHSHIEVLEDVFASLALSCNCLLTYCLLGLFKTNFFGRYLVFRCSSWFTSTHVHRTMAAVANFNLNLSSADGKDISKPLTRWLRRASVFAFVCGEDLWVTYRYIWLLSVVTL